MTRNKRRVSTLAVGLLCLLSNLCAQTPKVLDYEPGKKFWRSARNCGVNCMYLMLRAQAETCDYDTLLAATAVEERGSTPVQLREGAMSLGFKTEIVRAGPEDLPKANLPVVLYLTEFSDKMGEAGHYVLLTDLSPDGKSAFVFDGTTAMSGELPMSKLRRSWTGILVRRVPAIESLTPMLALVFGALGILLLLRVAWQRRVTSSEARGVLAMTALLCVAVPMAAQSKAPSASDAAPTAHAAPSAWTVMFRITRTSPLSVADQKTWKIDAGVLDTSECEFKIDGAKWTFLRNQKGREVTLRESVFYDGEKLFKHPYVGAPAMILDAAGIARQLKPFTPICSVEFLDWNHWTGPTTPARLGSPLTPRPRPRRQDLELRTTRQQGDVERSVWSTPASDVTEVWERRMDRAGAVSRVELRSGGHTTRVTSSAKWQRVGEHWWPMRMTRTSYARGDRHSATPILIEELEVLDCQNRCDDLGHAALDPKPGTIVYDSRPATESVGRDGLVGYVVPHDPEFLFRKLEQSTSTRAARPIDWRWWLVGIGLLSLGVTVACVARRRLRSSAGPRLGLLR